MQLFVYILYVFCIQIICIVLMMYTFCRSEFMYTKCIQGVYKMYPTFRQTFIYIWHRNFNCHSSFNFVYKMYTKVCQNLGCILHISCIYFVCVSCIHLVQFLYTKCTHNFHAGTFILAPISPKEIEDVYN